MSPFAVGSDRPPIVGAHGNAFVDGMEDFGEVGAHVFRPRDSAGRGRAAVFDDEQFLTGKPSAEAAEGMKQTAWPDGRAEELAVRGVF